MTRFQNLLSPDPQSTPAQEQRRASAGLADTVKKCSLRWRKGSEHIPGDHLLLAVAPYSQYDLVLLDLLDERLESGLASFPVYVANLQEYESVELLGADFPGVDHPHQTPLAALSRAGAIEKVAIGKKAREMIAEVIGIPAAELSQQVLVEAPSSTNSQALRNRTSTPEGQPKGSLTDDQRRFLWQCYREQLKAGGPARDRLPYTKDIDVIRSKFNDRFGTAFDHRDVWSALSDLDKNPDRRRSIGCAD